MSVAVALDSQVAARRFTVGLSELRAPWERQAAAGGSSKSNVGLTQSAQSAQRSKVPRSAQRSEADDRALDNAIKEMVHTLYAQCRQDVAKSPATKCVTAADLSPGHGAEAHVDAVADDASSDDDMPLAGKKKTTKHVPAHNDEAGCEKMMAKGESRPKTVVSTITKPASVASQITEELREDKGGEDKGAALSDVTGAPTAADLRRL